MQSSGAEEFLPERLSLKSLREAAAGCGGCDLWAPATQTVFGERLKTRARGGRDRAQGRLRDERRQALPVRGARRAADPPDAADVRDRVVPAVAPIVVATIHPSAILRAPDDAARVKEREAFVSDLRVAAEAIAA